MNFIDALLLALALCVDSFVVSATMSLSNRMSWRRGLLMAVVFGLCQAAFPMAGALAGDAASSFVESVDHWVAFAMLCFVGGKMILDAVGNKNETATKHRDSSLATFLSLGMATSIDALAVGVGLGLDQPLSTVVWVVATIGVTTFLVSVIGVAIGRRRMPVPERTATIVAGGVLIVLGTKILLEHLLH
ncbi:MAG: manganese efflux pump [Bacteroidales bacterium]|nr:manganese efflux pump [Bacteroidales bacterium]